MDTYHHQKHVSLLDQHNIENSIYIEIPLNITDKKIKAVKGAK